MLICTCDGLGDDSSHVWPSLINGDRTIRERWEDGRQLLNIGFGIAWRYGLGFGAMEFFLLKRVY